MEPKSPGHRRGDATTSTFCVPTTASDGVTEAQRRKLRSKFRSGMGLRPNPTDFQREAALVAEKLAEAGSSSRR